MDKNLIGEIHITSNPSEVPELEMKLNHKKLNFINIIIYSLFFLVILLIPMNIFQFLNLKQILTKSPTLVPSTAAPNLSSTSSSLENFQLNILGDDITFGMDIRGIGLSNFPAYAYPNLLENSLNIKVNSLSNRLATITKINPAGGIDFTSNVLELFPQSNFTFIFGGYNDFLTASIKPGQILSKNPYEFYGALNVIIERLLLIWKKEQICFILPIPRVYEDVRVGPIGNLKEVRTRIREIVEGHGIDWISFEGDLEHPTAEAPSEHYINGIFLNEKGHQVISKKLGEYLKKKGLI